MRPLLLCHIKDVARRVIIDEIKGLQYLADHIPESLSKVVDLVIKLKGKIIISGIGKSGYIARKIAASFSSTGTAAIYIHPAEASHGDLGVITKDDIVILLSNSGETKELFDIMKYCKRFTINMVTITMNPNSTLAKNSDYLLQIPKISEASSIDAPTTSAIMMLALGDAIMVSVQEVKGFTKNDFKVFHPGGKIGASLVRVSEIMHIGKDLPIVSPGILVSEVLIVITSKGLGCVAVVEDQKLIGVITDGDLRRHMSDNIVSKTARSIMTVNPKTIAPDMVTTQALALMESNNITSLLVVEQDQLLGVIHIHDLLRIGVI